MGIEKNFTSDKKIDALQNTYALRDALCAKNKIVVKKKLNLDNSKFEVLYVFLKLIKRPYIFPIPNDEKKVDYVNKTREPAKAAGFLFDLF